MSHLTCRICGGGDFGAVIDLGPMPLVNNLLAAPDAPCPRWPLTAITCRACSLVQLTEVPPPDALFTEYPYFSSQAATMLEHARRLVQAHVRPGDRVVEIASNDGYLLRPALDRGATVLGVEPAANVAAFAEGEGIPTRCDYFGRETAEDVRGTFGPADVIFANNVLAHVPDPHEIAGGIKVLLARDGIAHVEVPWIVPLLDAGAFDTIYHEHHCYFSVSALLALFRAEDLALVGVEPIEIHGGSLHLRVAHAGDEREAEALAARERDIGLFEDAVYQAFAERVDRLRDDLADALRPFERVGAFGAAAKGIVLLNHFGLDDTRIPWVADVSPHKQGRFVPGTGQEIVGPEVLLEEMPDACLILPWNIAGEIVRRNGEYLERGGSFVQVLPEVRVHTAGKSLTSPR